MRILRGQNARGVCQSTNHSQLVLNGWVSLGSIFTRLSRLVVKGSESLGGRDIWVPIAHSGDSAIGYAQVLLDGLIRSCFGLLGRITYNKFGVGIQGV